MRAMIDETMKQLLGDMVRARELTEQQSFEEARAAYLRLRTQCSRRGLRSAHVAWSLAVVSDGLGELEAALAYIREATEIDPLAIPYQRSYDVIVERIRRELGDESRLPDNPATPRLYELLLGVGEGDARSHLAMARWHHARGECTHALRILEAVTTLAPAFRPAWQLKAAVSRELGRDELATQAEVEWASLETRPLMPFGPVATAQG